MVGNFKASFLSHRLDFGDDFTHCAFFDKFGGKRGVEDYRNIAVDFAAETFLVFHGYKNIVL